MLAAGESVQLVSTIDPGVRSGEIGAELDMSDPAVALPYVPRVLPRMTDAEAEQLHGLGTLEEAIDKCKAPAILPAEIEAAEIRQRLENLLRLSWMDAAMFHRPCRFPSTCWPQPW